MAPKRVLLVLAIVAAFVASVGLIGATGDTGELAPRVAGRDLRGSGPDVQVPASGYRPTVVAFFASWCRQCRGELEVLQTYHERVGDQVQFVGVNFSDQRSGITELLEEVGVTFPVLADPRGDVTYRFGISGVPNTVFIDMTGHIVKRTHGYDWELADNLRELFGISASLARQP